MVLSNETRSLIPPMPFSFRLYAEREVDGIMSSKLRLTNDETNDAIPFPAESVSRIGRWAPKGLTGEGDFASTDEIIRQAESTLDRMDRQLAGLRNLLGDDFDRDDGPRAA